MRLARLQQIIHNAEIDVMALVPGPNLRYLTGVGFHLMERPFIVFVPSQGEPAIVVPALEMPQLQDTGFPGHYFAWTDAEGFGDAFRQAATTLDLADKRIGVEGLTMRVRESHILQEFAPSGQIIDADDVMVELRLIKSPDEIANHREAVRISELALELLLDRIQLGMTERKIASMLSDIQKEMGGEVDAFGPIVLIGPRSAFPHGETGNTPLQKGDALLIDFGTRHKGYVSDITRTFFVGEPSQHVKTLYAAVLAANEAGRKAARPGVSGAEVDKITTQVLIDAGFETYVKHRTGHGLGLAVHEPPNINADNKRPLEPGMVFTIEPGLYVAGEVGIRIEDNVVVTTDGVETLTRFPRELIELAI